MRGEIGGVEGGGAPCLWLVAAHMLQRSVQVGRLEYGSPRVAAPLEIVSKT